MLFSSFSYLLAFLPGVLLITILIHRWLGPRNAQAFVLVASLLFYCWDKPSRFPYLAASIVMNWLGGRMITSATEPARKRWLHLFLFANIAYLATFKYVNFFLREIPFLKHAVSIPDLGFPLGISFFTLAQVMYLVDCYEGLQPANSLFDHATFVSFFPYIISGPISKSKRIIHQFPRLGIADGDFPDKLASGICLISLGLFKKVVLADTFGHVADYGYGVSGRLSTIEVLCFSGAYVFQLYYDFSGYSDIAIGSARILGVEIPRNFDAPLRSKSIIEFWERWHISLSGFITTYLYTPILRSFSRITLVKASIATFLAMSIAGLWHGPSWTFVVFGVIHGVGLVVNQVWRKKKLPRLPKPLAWTLTFLLVDLSLISFRSPSLTRAVQMWSYLIPTHSPLATPTLTAMHTEGALSLQLFGLPIVIGLIAAFVGPSSEQWARDFAPSIRSAFAVATLFVVACVFMNSSVGKEFVYFAF